ncbi:MAG: hypothetical protein WBA16_04430 [Nonlabens sp.]
MVIKSAADPDEMDSPFYKANKKFCADFERFMATNDGQVKGSFNSWSYLIAGIITDPTNWKLTYKKSNFTTSGNLFLSAKSQSSITQSMWETELSSAAEPEFVICRKNLLNRFKSLLFKSSAYLEVSNQYMINTPSSQVGLIDKLTQVLKALLLSGEVYTIEYYSSTLKIELRTEKHHFATFERLVNELQELKPCNSDY